MTPPLTLGPARGDEAEALSQLALASKAHWGYDAAFLEACRKALRVTAEDVAAFPHFVAERAGTPVGFSALRVLPDGLHLDKLFVSPAAIRQGVGKCPWRHMLGEARATGVPLLLIGSDPYAEPFYLASGARPPVAVAAVHAVGPGRFAAPPGRGGTLTPQSRPRSWPAAPPASRRARVRPVSGPGASRPARPGR